MEKTIELLLKGFESSSGTTPEFLAFYRTFKRELTAELTKRGCTKIEIGKGHFYCSGFFTSPTGQVYYISLPDVRGINIGDLHFGSMLYRTAKDYKDYTGGSNQYVHFAPNMVKGMTIK